MSQTKCDTKGGMDADERGKAKERLEKYNKGKRGRKVSDVEGMAEFIAAKKGKK